MKARMEKYDSDTTVKQRTKRNEGLYTEVQNMNIDFVDVDIDNAIDLTFTSNSRTSREDYQKQKELNKILPQNEKREKIINQDVVPKEERIYDIDEILKMARENKLFEETDKKRLINTEYNILTKLDVQSLKNEEFKKEDLRSLIDNIYENEKPVEKKKYTRKAEERLLNDLFDDDIEEKEELEEELRLKEELSQKILAKEDIEIIEPKDEDEPNSEKPLSKENSKKQDENMEDFIEEKEGKGLLIAIIIVSILILLTCGFFAYEYFFGL